MVHKLNELSIFLLCAIPFLLVTGPFLPDLFLSIISVLYIVKCIIQKDFSYFKNKYFLIIASFYFYLIVRSLLSINPLLSLESSLFYFRFGVFCIAVFSLLNYSEKTLKYFFYSMTTIFLILTFDSIIQLSFGQNILGYEKPDHRLNSLFGKEYKMGSYFVRLLPLYLCLLFFFKKNLNYFELIVLFVFGIFFLLIYVSGERTAFFLLILFTLLFLLTELGKDYRKKILIISSSILVLSSLIFPIAFKRMFIQTFKEFGFIEFFQGNLSSLKIFTSLHTSHFQIGIEMFQDNFLFGQGTKIFRFLCNEPKFNSTNIIESCTTHPHNIYIQLLSETGIIGFLFIISLFLYSLILFFKSLKTNLKMNKEVIIFFQILIISLIINLWPFVPSNNFFNNWINVVYHLPIGFILYFYKKSIIK